MDFTGVPMDDFQAILGMDFLKRRKTAVMPYSNFTCVMEDKRPYLYYGHHQQTTGIS